MSLRQSRLIMGLHPFNKMHDELTDFIGLLQFQMRKTSNTLAAVTPHRYRKL